jgi:hypothetical protein
MKLSSPPKWVEKLVWVPVILLRKNSHSQLWVCLPCYAETGRSHPPNRETLRITLTLACKLL